MTADCRRAAAAFSNPAASARKRPTPPAAAARRESASSSRRNVLGSVATAAGQRDIAGFPAIGTIVKTIGAKANVYLSLADGAVLFTSAAIFRQVTLRTKGLTLHKSLSRKLYLSVGGRGKAKVRWVRRVAYLPLGAPQNPFFPDSRSVSTCPISWTSKISLTPPTAPLCREPVAPTLSICDDHSSLHDYDFSSACQ